MDPVIPRRGLANGSAISQGAAMARVLVIDDDQTIRQLIVTTLEEAGHQVMQAGSGREGTMLFKHQPADVVITDLIMPDDSLDNVLTLRMENPTLPFILISGGIMDSSRLEDAAVALRARCTLPKPFKLAELVAATATALAGQKSRPGAGH